MSASNRSGTRSKAVTLADVVAILNYVGTRDGGPPNASGVDYDTDLNGNGIKDGREYDRSPSTDASELWRSGAPSGAVTISDAIVALAQVGADCTAPP